MSHVCSSTLIACLMPESPLHNQSKKPVSKCQRFFVARRSKRSCAGRKNLRKEEEQPVSLLASRLIRRCGKHVSIQSKSKARLWLNQKWTPQLPLLVVTGLWRTENPMGAPPNSSAVAGSTGEYNNLIYRMSGSHIVLSHWSASQ